MGLPMETGWLQYPHTDSNFEVMRRVGSVLSAKSRQIASISSVTAERDIELGAGPPRDNSDLKPFRAETSLVLGHSRSTSIIEDASSAVMSA